MTPTHPLASELDEALACAEADVRSLAGGRVFVAGGTGFVGAWLLGVLDWGARRLNLDVRVTALTREPATWMTRRPELASSAVIDLVSGDVRDFEFPPGEFAAVILGAASSDNAWTLAHPLEAAATIEAGTKHGLDLAEASGARRVLLLSSGAVYGPQPPEMDAIPETYPGQPSDDDAYGRAKRSAELLAAGWTDSTRAVVISRIFNAYGPHQPLDTHFAIGNFIADAVAGRPVTVRGDGSAVRSYLYGADLAVALLACLVRGSPGAAYNVGGDLPVRLGELAQLVASAVSPAVEVRVLGRPGASDRYVPDIRRIAAELGFTPTVRLRDGVRRTMAFASRGSDPA